MSNIAALKDYALPSTEKTTEDDVAIQFRERHIGELRFDHDRGSWYVWTGNYWRLERTGLAFDHARRLARSVSDDAKARSLKKTSFAAGVERFARTDRAFAVTSEDWDADPFLLATPGGTVDLRTGALRPSRPEDRITKVTAVAPAPVAECPLWLRFLDEAMASDAELIEFLRQFMGYSLTGSTSEHALVFGYGGGRNGKSVFVNTVRGIMNDHAVTAAMDSFVASAGDRHSTDVASLRGARLVTASETEEGRAWAESRIKQMTGGDPITARFMRQDNFTYTPQFKLFIVGNHKPILKNVDEAARRRFCIVPFTTKPKVPDRDLETKLRGEWPSILRWMIDGCLDWQRRGLVRPKSVLQETAAYFDAQDFVGQFVEEECDVDEYGKRSPFLSTSAELFSAWVDYAKAAGEPPGAQRALTESLLLRGCVLHKIRGTRMLKGIRLKVQKDRRAASEDDEPRTEF